MAFDRLTNLGNEKFQRVVNELMRGTPPPLLARLIQQEWGDVHDVREDTLAKQLKRLHIAMLNGVYGGEIAQEARRKASVQITELHGSTVDCLRSLLELADLQRERIFALAHREHTLGRALPALNVVVRDYRDVLVAMQKVKFDLGLDPYLRGMATGTPQDSGPAETARLIENRELETIIRQAEDIMDRRGIPRDPAILSDRVRS